MAIKGKRGIFLTFIAIAMTTAFIVIFTPDNTINTESQEVIETRIERLNAIIDELENSILPTTIQSVGTKTYFGLIQYMNDNGEFLSSVNAAFIQALETGEYQSQVLNNLTGNTLPEWIQRIENATKETYDIDVNVSLDRIQTYQNTPWHVVVNATFDIELITEVAEFSHQAIVISEIPIESFNDPFYSVNTGGIYRNRFNQSPVQFDKWNITAFQEHVHHGNYVHFADSQAPSFLMRMENRTTNSSCCGVESVVNPQLVADNELYRSYVDYHYFNTTPGGHSCTEFYNISSIYPTYEYIKLNLAYLSTFNITLSNVAVSCV